MTREIIAIAWRQLAMLLLLIISPLAIMLLVVTMELDPDPEDSGVAALIASVLCIGAAAVVAWAMTSRRAVQLADDALRIQHSFYTLEVSRGDAHQLKVEQVQSLDDLAITIKKNGVAAFGYLSGWFYGPSGALMFCAVSEFPVFRLKLHGNTRCRLIAISCSHEMAAAIRAWAGAPGHQP